VADRLIRGGTLILADQTKECDVRIVGETIEEIGDGLPTAGAEIIDAKGKLILPGGVDPHTHFDLPMFGTVTSDDHYTGMKAAAFGGTTTVLDFVPQSERGSLAEAVEAWHAKAAARAAVDYGFHMNITRLDDSVMEEIPTLADRGITSLKVFTAYNGRLRLQDGEIFRVLRLAGRNGMLTLLHGENGDVIDILVDEALRSGHTAPIWHARTRPAWGAVEAALRGIALAAQAAAPLYIVHANTAGEVDQIRYARERGLPVLGETCPQYLFFTEAELERPDGAKFICSPPLRTRKDQEELWAGLQDGSLKTLGTDHCSFFYDGSRPIRYEGKPVAIAGKELGASDFTKIPNGLPGVGDRLPVLWSYGVVAGKITPQQFVALTSTNPARVFGLYPKKGTLRPGSDADVVIWDPEARITYGAARAQHRTDYNLYEGWELKGYPETVMLRGKTIVSGGEWKGSAGSGQFLQRGQGQYEI
jgi:dihydropyrimidinase